MFIKDNKKNIMMKNKTYKIEHKYEDLSIYLNQLTNITEVK